MKGAIDNLDTIRAIIDDLALPRSYIHADGALHGMILPFVDDPQPFAFDSGIDSIAISGHKMIGSPIPCGVVVTKKEYTAQIGRAIEYVGALDTTLLGSRNAITPMIIWYALTKHGTDGYREMVAKMLDTAEYAVQQFNANEIPAWRGKNSPIVVFPRPSQYVLLRWQLAPLGDIAHLITMQHVTREMIDEVIAGLPSMAARGVRNMNQSETDIHIIVIVRDQPGGLARITTALAEAEINIEMIDGHGAGEFGIVRLSTDNDDEAMRVLLQANLRTVTSDVVLFRLPDKPGALAEIAQRFGSHDINVRTIHIVHRLAEHAIVAVTTDNDDLARTLIDADALL